MHYVFFFSFYIEILQHPLIFSWTTQSYTAGKAQVWQICNLSKHYLFSPKENFPLSMKTLNIFPGTSQIKHNPNTKLLKIKGIECSTLFCSFSEAQWSFLFFKLKLPCGLPALVAQTVNKKLQSLKHRDQDLRYFQTKIRCSSLIS